LKELIGFLKDKIALYSNELLQELENQWKDAHSRIEKLKSDMEQTIFGLEMKLSLIKIAHLVPIR
jgi:hypothetical protein